MCCSSDKQYVDVQTMATNFIEDLPSGPLDDYRKQASFDWKKMQILTEGEKQLKFKV